MDMKKKVFPVFYFSGTGNTWWAATRVAEELNKRGFRASAHSIEQASAKEAADLVRAADMVGLGFPIYGSDAPVNFRAFLKGLPDQEIPIPTLGFVTQWAWSGDGMNFLARELREKGFDLRWAAEFNLFNNIALTIFPAPYSADYDTFRPKLEKVEGQIQTLCEKIANDTNYRQHGGWIDAALGWIQRGPYRMVHDWGRKFWSVDAETCNACGRCARICQAGNIHMVDQLPVYGLACVYCMRCYNYCPTYAVRYMGRSNERLADKPPFQGPVPAFKPELIMKKVER